MNYMVCVDDTDMPGTKGTGWLVQNLCEILETRGLGKCSPISRHQLFVHPDIPFTSHNSAMCFELIRADEAMDPVIQFMAEFLETRCEKGSDPGLCVARVDTALNTKGLIEFGKMAKKVVTSKQAAYDLARQTRIHLSEHGGTGGGVIGAVAGVGLRLSGDDGRYRGWFHLGMPGDIVCVDQLCQLPFIDQLVTTTGTILSREMSVHVGSEKTKTVRLGNQQVVVVTQNETAQQTGLQYRTITKQEAKQY